MNAKVAIIILNWNGWKDTIECLESLYQISYPNYNAIVVDNGSEDDSVRRIKEYCEGKIMVESKFFEYDPINKPIKIIEYAEAEAEGGKEKEIYNLPSNKKLILIKNDKNYGFAEGNNIGMRYALKVLTPDYVLLLNNDTVVNKEFLRELVEVGESDEKIGFAGPKTYHYNFNGRKDVINFAGGKLDMWKGQSYHIGINEIDKGQYDEIRKVEYVEGSCLLARKEMIKNVGLLSSNYFAYWEETDWCVSGHRAGYKSIYVPKAKIWHKIASSSGGTSSFRHIYYMTRNRFLFMKKNATKCQLCSFLLHFFGFQFWFTIAMLLIIHKNLKVTLSFCRGVRDGLASTSGRRCVMILKDLTCLCGCKDFVSLFKGTKSSPEFNYPLNFSILKCKKCGLARTYPIPYKGNIKYEDPEHASKCIENETIINKDVFKLIAHNTLKEIGRYKRAGRLLDVGCGACTLLDLAKNNGWETYGVELSKVHCQYAQSIGLSVRDSTLSDVGFPDGYFDVVSMIHILEHVIDPIKDLREVKRVLKDDGIIVIDTPNIGTLIAKIQRERYLPLQPDCHVWQFTPTTLTNLLARAGFTSIRVVKHSRSFQYLVLLCMLNDPRRWMSRAGRLRIFLRICILFNPQLRKIIKNSITIVLCLLCRMGVCGSSVRIIARKTTNVVQKQK